MRLRCCTVLRRGAVPTTSAPIRLPVFSLQSPSDVFINAATATSCPLDIRDGRGCSLADAYGFDVALFSPRYSLTLRQDAVTLQTDIPPLSTFSQWTAEPPSTSAPFGACRLTFAHTGNRPEVAHFLTESLQRDSIFRLQVQDARYFIEDTCSVRTDMLPIRVKLCDAEEADAPWMLCVSNPSALPMEWGLVLLPRIESHCAAEGPV